MLAGGAEKPSIPAAEPPRPEVLPAEPPQWTEQELASRLLAQVPAVGLDMRQALAAIAAVRSATSVGDRLRGPEQAVLSLLPESTLDSLPFAEGSDCKLPAPQARSLDKYSDLLQKQVSLSDRNSGRHPSTSILSDRDQALAYALKKGRRWQTADAIPAMRQIMQVEPVPVRVQMVEMWAGYETPQATLALLNRAIFDLSPEVRQSANKALVERYQAGDRPELLEALRYPWPAAAWNAAETLVAVQDHRAVPELIELLDASDPAKPCCDSSGIHQVRELVRIHHSQNCLLCHALSRDKNEPATRVVPGSDFVPRGVTGPRRGYYQSPSSAQPDYVLVRADVTYLRQDFSVMHSPQGATRGFGAQRFDYLVQTREATPEEIADMETSDLEYPQRDAVLSALRRLTGRDAGNQSEDWRRMKF
jgi:hypothetical protein